jgi:hypothetical protein
MQIIDTETVAAMALETFIGVSNLLKSERLSVTTELTFYKALIRSIMTCACPAWEFAGNSHLLKLQRLQNKVLRTTGNLPRSTLTSDLRVSFKIPYLYDFVTKPSRQQAEVIQNHENVNVRDIGQGEAQHRNYKRLSLGDQTFDRSDV